MLLRMRIGCRFSRDRSPGVKLAVLSLALSLLASNGVAGPMEEFSITQAIAFGEHEKAIGLLRPLAEANEIEAQYVLGYFLYKRKDDHRARFEARTWFTRAAERGHPGAQTRLGFILFEEKKNVEAANWWRKAAEQGHALGQLLLGSSYMDGIGMPQNFTEAHKWINLAVARLPEGDNRAQGIAARTQLERLMDASELAEARNLARDWTPKLEGPIPSRKPLYAVIDE